MSPRSAFVGAAIGAWLCAAAQAQAVAAPPSPPAAASAPAGAAAPRIEIDAPSTLKALLNQYLDLVRLTRLQGDEPIDEAEWLRLMAAAPAQARSLLQTEGYFEPEVRVRREPGLPLRLSLEVVPGPRVRVTAVRVHAEGEVERRRLAGEAPARDAVAAMGRAGPLRAGVPFRNAAWGETKVNWVSALRVAGYAAADIRRSAADIDVAAGAARLEAVVDSGPLFLAGPLHVEGLKAHDLETVGHLAGFGPGQPLTETLLLDFQDRLHRAGLFEAVSVSFEPRPEHAQAAPVNVRLREQPLQQATVGVGISTDAGPRVQATHSHRRLFGWAVTATHRIEWGRDSQRLAGDFLTHPGENFSRKLLGVQIERERSGVDVVLSQRLRLGRTQDTPAQDRLVFAEVLRSRQSVEGGPTFDAEAISGNAHVVLRRLDSPLLPTRGHSLSLQLGAGLARSNHGEHGPFARVLARWTLYRPLGGSWLGRLRLEAGQILKRDAVIVPDVLGFRAGGDDSVRGYSHRSLTPVVAGRVVSGNAVATASAEVARPIVASLPSVLGAVFVDAGRAVDRWSDFKPAIGYGFGVRWHGPIGPVQADLAWADELRRLRLHLSMGVTF